jgi:hypothetical protein
MQDNFHTLYDFLLHSESTAYILMGAVLIFLLCFWLFLIQRDED